MASRKMGISDMPSDFIRRELEYIQELKPTRIINKLPINVSVIVQNSMETRQLVLIAPHAALSVASGELQTGDMIHFTSVGDTPYFVGPSQIVRKHLGDISIGAVVAMQGGYNRDVHPNGDISSIRIHNMLPWAISITYKGKVVGRVKQNTRLGQTARKSSTTAPHIYFDNGNMGLKLGDSFKISTHEHGLLYSFAIVDRNISEIFIGAGSTATDSHTRPETYRYRLGDTVRPYNQTTRYEHILK